MTELIYLDNAATTRMREECVDIIKEYACKHFYNPSASYAEAVKCSHKLDEAREVILHELGAKNGDVLFTSGATESNNLAIRGTLRNGKWEYVFSCGEHPSVYNTAVELKNLGHIVHFVPLQKNGQIDYDALAKVLNEKTRLISVIHVSNETGAINDLSKISALKKKLAPNAVFHVDGVQAFCKIPVDLSMTEVDLYTISAHKFHGPKGVGALYVKNKDALKNINFGGGQELGKRPGTENIPAIMAMSKAIELNDYKSDETQAKMKGLKSAFLKVFENQNRVHYIETDSPYIVSMSFEGVNGETFMRALQQEVIISTGSACSAKYAGNRILESMGFDKDYIKSSVRVSFDAALTEKQVVMAAQIVLQTYNEIWEKVK